MLGNTCHTYIYNIHDTYTASSQQAINSIKMQLDQSPICQKQPKCPTQLCKGVGFVLLQSSSSPPWVQSTINLGCFQRNIYIYMGVSENGGTLKSSILIRISIINHPFWGTPIFGNTHIYTYIYIYPINTHYIRCTVYRVDYEGPSIPRVPSFCI